MMTAAENETTTSTMTGILLLEKFAAAVSVLLSSSSSWPHSWQAPITMMEPSRTSPIIFTIPSLTLVTANNTTNNNFVSRPTSSSSSSSSSSLLVGTSIPWVLPALELHCFSLAFWLELMLVRSRTLLLCFLAAHGSLFINFSLG